MIAIPVSGGAFAPYDVVVGRGLMAEAGRRIAALVCLLYTSPSPRDRG